jgi:hypothetical protein
MRAKSPERIARDIVEEFLAENDVGLYRHQIADLRSRIATEVHFDRQRQFTEQRAHG